MLNMSHVKIGDIAIDLKDYILASEVISGWVKRLTVSTKVSFIFPPRPIFHVYLNGTTVFETDNVDAAIYYYNGVKKGWLLPKKPVTKKVSFNPLDFYEDF